MSSKKTLILSNTVLEMFMMAWEKLGKKYLHLEPYTTVGLEWVVKYYKKMDKTRANLVAMSKYQSLFISSQLVKI